MPEESAQDKKIRERPDDKFWDQAERELRDEERKEREARGVPPGHKPDDPAHKAATPSGPPKAEGAPKTQAPTRPAGQPPSEADPAHTQSQPSSPEQSAPVAPTVGATPAPPPQPPADTPPGPANQQPKAGQG